MALPRVPAPSASAAAIVEAFSRAKSADSAGGEAIDAAEVQEVLDLATADGQVDGFERGLIGVLWKGSKATVEGGHAYVAQQGADSDLHLLGRHLTGAVALAKGVIDGDPEAPDYMQELAVQIAHAQRSDSEAGPWIGRGELTEMVETVRIEDMVNDVSRAMIALGWSASEAGGHGGTPEAAAEYERLVEADDLMRPEDAQGVLDAQAYLDGLAKQR